MTILRIICLAIFCFAVACNGYNEEPCSSYDHPDYGTSGQCIDYADCPGNKYISNLCPTQGSRIKCCFTANTDEKCATYDHTNYGEVGHCVDESECPYSNYLSYLCPTKPANVKCCFSKPSCTTAAKELACEIMKSDQVTLLQDNQPLNQKGAGDGADPYSNIVDMCNGGKAKRSSYCCSDIPKRCAPGGYVCLSESVLRYILKLISEGYSFQVNSLAGACHSNNSKHYAGRAVDLQIKSGSEYSEWRKECEKMDAVENFGPPDRGHSGHTHCAFGK